GEWRARRRPPAARPCGSTSPPCQSVFDNPGTGRYHAADPQARAGEPMAKKLTPKTILLDAAQMARVIRRMAGEIVEKNRGVSDLLLVGIRTRGVPLAEALAAEIERMEGHPVPIGSLDITLHPDGLSTVGAQ